MEQHVDDIRKALENAVRRRSSVDFELALDAAYRQGPKADLADVLCVALVMDFHTRHEDVAAALQRLRPASAASALLQAASMSFEYLDYDEFNNLARKCTWALADIGTAEARAALNELARSHDARVSGYAKRRLDRWDVEARRKRG